MKSFLTRKGNVVLGILQSQVFLRQDSISTGSSAHERAVCFSSCGFRLYFSHSGYSGASLPANGPDPAATTGTLLSLVSSWHGQLARVPRPVRNKTLLISLSFPLSFLSLTLPILPCFSSPLVLEPGIWLKGLQPDLRIGDWSPPLGKKTQILVLISGRAKFQSSLLWKPREKSRKAWVSVGGRRRL